MREESSKFAENPCSTNVQFVTAPISVSSILRDFERWSKHSFEASLLVLIVQQNYRDDPERSLAIAASGRLALHVLHEPIGEVIRSPRPARGLGAGGAAMRARKLDPIILGIAIQRGPACVAHSNSFD
jgi:hypothetical protein